MMWSLIKSSCLRQYIVVIIVNLSILTSGMSMAWPSPVLIKLQNGTEINLSHPITAEEGSWIVSVGFLCSTFGNGLLGMLLDQIGRKYCLLLTGIVKTLISILFIFADKVWLFILGRAIIGMADYFLYCTVPVYVSEISDVNRRGVLGTFLQILSSLGFVITLSVGPLVSYKIFSIVFAALNVVTFVPLFIIPDSPYYLYSKGKTDRAVYVLKFFRGSDDCAQKEIDIYMSWNNKENYNTFKLFKKKAFLKSIVLSILLSIATQFSGFNAVSFYLQTILESTKTNVMPELASTIIGLIQLLASLFSSSVSDRIKRKHILVLSLIGMLIGMIGLGAFFKIRESTQITGILNYLPLISLILVVFCYSAGLGSLFWVLVPEFFDDISRALGVAITLQVTAFNMFITTKYFSLVTLAIGPPLTYWCFGGVCLLTCLFINYCLPETQGKTFKEIQDVIEGKREHNKDLRNID